MKNIPPSRRQQDQLGGVQVRSFWPRVAHKPLFAAACCRRSAAPACSVVRAGWPADQASGCILFCCIGGAEGILSRILCMLFRMAMINLFDRVVQALEKAFT